MISILILSIIIIGLVSLVAHSIVGLYSSAASLDLLTQEMRLEALWVDAISRHLVAAGPNGEYIAPIGQPILSDGGLVIGHGLPAFVEAPKQNSLGMPVRYCALGHEPVLSPDNSSNTKIWLNSTATYLVEAMTINGKNYAYRGDDISGMTRNSHNIVAFVISPTEINDNLSCQDVRYDQDNGTYRVVGMDASVLPVLAPHVFTP